MDKYVRHAFFLFFRLWILLGWGIRPQLKSGLLDMAEPAVPAGKNVTCGDVVLSIAPCHMEDPGTIRVS